MFLPSINILHLTFSEIQHTQPPTPTHPDTMGENNIHTALKDDTVKTKHYQDIFLIIHNQSVRVHVKCTCKSFEIALMTDGYATVSLIGLR